MIFNQSNAATVLRGIFSNLKTTFQNAFDAAPAQWNKIAMEVPSNGKRNDYAWLNKFPKLQKWIGDKVVKQLTGQVYTIVNDDYEATVAVDRNDIEDDQLGIYKPQAESAGESAKQWPDELVFAALTAGFTEKCYDGKPFIATDHQVGGKNKVSVSNKLTKALSADSQAAAKASYGAARIMLRSMKDDEGRSLGINPNVLVVGPALEDIARTLLTVDRLDDGKANLYKGTAELVVDTHLKTDTEWYLMDTKRAIKPIIFQPRKKPVFVNQVNPDSPDVFMRKEFKFGAEARGAAGYGLWQLVVGSTGTDA